MNMEIKGKPSFAFCEFTLSPGNSLICESGAMTSMSAGLDISARLNGGFFSALGRKLLGGESMFISEYLNNTGEDKHLTISQCLPGDICLWELINGPLCLQPGAFIASTGGVKLGLGWAGLASFVGREGLFKLKVGGEGVVTRLEGKGTYYMQTRSMGALAGWLNPKIV